jgi:hypothetical protein
MPVGSLGRASCAADRAGARDKLLRLVRYLALTDAGLARLAETAPVHARGISSYSSRGSMIKSSRSSSAPWAR